MAELQSNDNNTCVVCFKNVEYYSIGECDHPVCFECSTRMRVLCLQNECPICRQVLSRVVFTDTVQPYKELRNRVFTDRLFERQFKIGFSSEAIKQAYDILLENRCKLCENISPFRTFSMLSDHMRKAHERYFCDLCVKHLKIFTSERRCYTRQELAHHRRKGDLDNTSHRGHPLCEFCEERFMDADELYRHLRKEHLYCHLCDADGRNLYYATHAALAHHFRTDHFLCEEGDCVGNHLTAVFRTEIDLKAHKATVHGKGLTRGAARQARTLELQFNITPHTVNVQQRTPRERRSPSPPPPPPPAPRIDTRSDAQFPRLSAAPAQPTLLLGGPQRSYKGVDGLARTDKNFPTLGGAGPAPRPAPAPSAAAPAAAILRNSKPSVSIQLHSQPASASNFRLTQTSGHRISVPAKKPPILDDDFPSLGGPRDDFPSLGGHRDDHPNIGSGSLQPPKVTMINSQEMQAMKNNNNHSGSGQSKKPALSSEAFPALSSSAAPTAPPQWITVAKEKGKAKAKAKPEPPPPAPKTPAFNPVADFPTLPANKAKKKTPQNQQPQPQPPPPPQTESKPSKKEKKKQNAIKKENLDEPPTPTYVNGFTNNFTKKQISEAYNAAVNLANTTDGVDKKIKTIEETSTSVTVNVEKKRNGGNGDFALAAKDYPPLSSKNGESVVNPPNPMPAKKSANGARTPNGAPPGFSSKARPPCDGMTFTNSAGQTFPAPPHDYIPPPDFEQRNRALVKKLVSASSTKALEDFKEASRLFRDSQISADQFYEHCQRAMGRQLKTLFPDLVALLPDIGKQQELVVGRDVMSQLEVCKTCGQLISPSDSIAHDTAHWPALTPH